MKSVQWSPGDQADSEWMRGRDVADRQVLLSSIRRVGAAAAQ